MSFIMSWIGDTVSGYVKTGLEAGGTMAGNAVGGVGNLVESSGRNVGESVSGMIVGVGDYINGYGNGFRNAMSADGPIHGGGKKKAIKPPAKSSTRAGPATAAIGAPRKPSNKLELSSPIATRQGTGNKAISSTYKKAKPAQAPRSSPLPASRAVQSRSTSSAMRPKIQSNDRPKPTLNTNISGLQKTSPTLSNTSAKQTKTAFKGNGQSETQRASTMQTASNSRTRQKSGASKTTKQDAPRKMAKTKAGSNPLGL